MTLKGEGMKTRFISRYEIVTDPLLLELLSWHCFNLAGIFAKKYIKVYEDFEKNGFVVNYE
jgi:hypothetical protein